MLINTKRTDGYTGYAGKLLYCSQISDITQPNKAITYEDNDLIIKKIDRERRVFIIRSYTLSVITDVPNTLKRAANI